MTDTAEKENPSITFHLIKGPHFETHKVDGSLGNFAPGGISLSFYVERNAIPQTMTHEIKADGSLGKSVGATGKQGMVREVQTGVILDMETAKGLINQITKLIDQANRAVAE